MEKKKVLGRGLGSLLGVLDEVDEMDLPKRKEEFKKLGVCEVEMGLIDNNPNQPRKNFSPTSLNELADSIRTHGVIQPIILKLKDNGRYMIVAGERRFRASKIAGLKKIPAVIRDYTDAEIKEVSLLENIQREDLNPIETARALKELLSVYNWTQEVLADRLGKSRPAITNYIRLLNLTPSVIALIEDGRLSAGHAKCLVVVQNPEVQFKLAQMAIFKRLTVRDMEKTVRELESEKGKKSKPRRVLSLELNEFKQNLERKFATKVEIRGNDKKGCIEIKYFSKEDLDRIYEVLK